MTQYEHDEAVTQQLHMAVIDEVDNAPTLVARWAAVMRRLNAIDIPLDG